MEAFQLDTDTKNMEILNSNSIAIAHSTKNITVHQLHPNTWVDKYADYLFNYAVARVNDSEVSKDLVQETFFAGLKSANNYKGDAAERTWLIAILKRKVIDHYRKINSNKGKAEIRMNYSLTFI